jgi:hypothetical protein
MRVRLELSYWEAATPHQGASPFTEARRMVTVHSGSIEVPTPCILDNVQLRDEASGLTVAYFRWPGAGEVFL